MKYSGNALSLAEHFEGCELKAYQDAGGKWTIGYGHTKGVYPGQTITLIEAENYAQDDLQDAENCVNDMVTVPLSQGEFDALCDFVFNLGPEEFEQSTLLRLLNSGDFVNAAKQFERWDHCGGRKVAGLLRRRIAEENLFDGKKSA